MRILFFGTPLFAAKLLEKILQAGHEVVGIVTQPDRPRGRWLQPQPSAVKEVAEEICAQAALFQPEKVSTNEWAERLRACAADLFVVVAYGEIIGQQILDIPRLGCINVHPSLLPKYRGAAPIQRAIIAGEEETGVTIMHMVRKMDAGDIIKQERVPLDENVHFGVMEERLCSLGGDLLLRVFEEIESGTTVRRPQEEEGVTFAPKVTPEDCEIDWSRPARVIHNLIRGVNPHPGAWCWIRLRGGPKRCKIWETRVVDHIGEEKAGTPILLGRMRWGVCCGEGSIEIHQLQLEGKKSVSGEEWLRGCSLEEMQF